MNDARPSRPSRNASPHGASTPSSPHRPARPGSAAAAAWTRRKTASGSNWNGAARPIPHSRRPGTTAPATASASRNSSACARISPNSPATANCGSASPSGAPAFTQQPSEPPGDLLPRRDPPPGRAEFDPLKLGKARALPWTRQRPGAFGNPLISISQGPGAPPLVEFGAMPHACSR